MTDRLSKNQRHKCMASICSKNTRPELLVRKFLFNRGYRYRLNYPNLPGHPDIVLHKYKTVIFVNGCFWHGHKGCKYYAVPKTNTEFWVQKIKKNQERDIRVQQELAKMGWHCITIWECQLKKAVKQQTLESLDYTLNHIFLSILKKNYNIPKEESYTAAELKDFSEMYKHSKKYTS